MIWISSKIPHRNNVFSDHKHPEIYGSKAKYINARIYYNFYQYYIIT